MMDLEFDLAHCDRDEIRVYARLYLIACAGAECCLGGRSEYVNQVIKYESVIHEFDPYFNFRVTQVSVRQASS